MLYITGWPLASSNLGLFSDLFAIYTVKVLYYSSYDVRASRIMGPVVFLLHMWVDLHPLNPKPDSRQ